MRKTLIIIGCSLILFSVSNAVTKSKYPAPSATNVNTEKTEKVEKTDKAEKTAKTGKAEQQAKGHSDKHPHRHHNEHHKIAKVAKPKLLLDQLEEPKPTVLLASNVNPLPKASPVLLDAPRKLAIQEVTKPPVTEPDNVTPSTNLATVASKISKSNVNSSNKWINVDMDWAALWQWSRTKQNAKQQAEEGETTDYPVYRGASICKLVAAHPDWYRAAKATEAKWGVPVPVQFAIIRTESKFNGIAKNPSSSAYGYAQALRGTWHRYQAEQASKKAKRDDFTAASDFIGWYAGHMEDELGIDSSDAYRLYLAYHDGGAAYKRQVRHGRFKSGKLAHHVQRDATNFAGQLSMCTLV